jgi:DNA gyrase inhibitor GyrI
MNMGRNYLLIGLGVGLTAVAWWIYKRSRFDAEPTPYIVLRRDKRFELRRYPSLPVATTPIRGDNDEAFMRLFRFIDRDNATGEKIAMTTPVFFDGEPGAQNKMSFVMPEKNAWAGVPEPSTAAVTLDERPAQRVAVYRFSGATRAETEREAVARLRTWLRSEGLQSFGEPVIAYYDAPFIPGFLRRNEVMLRIAE